MSDLKGVFDSLYTGLLLRDLGAKVAPGMIVLVAVRVAMTNTTITTGEIQAANLGLWLAAIAVAWLTGLSVQGLGDLLGRIGDKYPKFAFLPVRYNPPSKTWKQWTVLLKRFDTAFPSGAIEQQRLERLIVIREATGNGFVAVAIATVILAVKAPSLGLFLVGVLVLVGLAALHCSTAQRLWEYTESVAPPEAETTKTHQS